MESEVVEQHTVLSSTTIVHELRPDMEDVFRGLKKLFGCLLISRKPKKKLKLINLLINSINSRKIKASLKNCLESLSRASDIAERHLRNSQSSISELLINIGKVENEKDYLSEQQKIGSQQVYAKE